MAIAILTENLAVHQSMADEPNGEDGLTAGEVKAKLDQAALAIQKYLNETVVPAAVSYTHLDVYKRQALNLGWVGLVRMETHLTHLRVGLNICLLYTSAVHRTVCRQRGHTDLRRRVRICSRTYHGKDGV